jgi:tRNA1(Val) A37 N6-methylase TrmN6
VITAFVMATIAEGVGRTFIRFAPLEAYRWDIVGSIGGIGAFSALAFLHAPPIAWGAIAAAAFLWLLDRPGPIQVGALAASLVILSLLSFAPRTSWSPYYRITTSPQAHDGSIAIAVNGRPHQRIMPLATMEEDQTFRFEPYAHVPDHALTNVLIVGAGSGNDVAIALSRGAEHVDAVEIDPLLYGLGRDHHPDRPYQDPRVSVHVEDARSFLHDTDARYDLVLYAIPDSLTVLAGQSSLRLESYLLTVEAMREVRAHLRPHGAIAMVHYYLPSVIDRYASALDEVFGEAPCLDLAPGAGPRPRTVLTAAMDPGDLVCADRWHRPAAVIDPVTDDHPFAYLVGSGIPGFYQVALLLILVASAIAVRVATGPFRAMRPFLDLFAMGAAFLLLETSNVVRFALLFGTTWIVNALVFAGILASVSLAIEVARRLRVRRPSLLYVPLFAAIAVAWAVPPGALLGLAPPARFLAAVALGFTPVFIANLIFADRFRDVGASAVAFGTNLLGAMVGGVAEYAAIVFGYRALLLLVAAFYGLAFVLERRVPERAVGAAGGAESPSAPGIL